MVLYRGAAWVSGEARQSQATIGTHAGEGWHWCGRKGRVGQGAWAAECGTMARRRWCDAQLRAAARPRGASQHGPGQAWQPHVNVAAKEKEGASALGHGRCSLGRCCGTLA